MNGRPLKYVNIGAQKKVFDLIPEDGKCKRFMKLEEECKEHGISYRILRQELKRLEEAGTIVKEAVKAKRGAGTCYRRDVPFHAPGLSQGLRSSSNMIAYLISSVDEMNTEEGKAAMASQGLFSVLWSLHFILHHELAIYTENPDKEDAEKRLDSILMDFIFPMIKRTIVLAVLPGACDIRASLAMEKIIVDNLDRWVDVWRSIEVPEGKLSIEDAKRKIAEIKERAGIKD